MATLDEAAVSKTVRPRAWHSRRRVEEQARVLPGQGSHGLPGYAGEPVHHVRDDAREPAVPAPPVPDEGQGGGHLPHPDEGQEIGGGDDDHLAGGKEEPLLKAARGGRRSGGQAFCVHGLVTGRARTWESAVTSQRLGLPDSRTASRGSVRPAASLKKAGSGLKPRAMVAEAWESASTGRVRAPRMARAWARRTATTVLPVGDSQNPPGHPQELYRKRTPNGVYPM
jgi:hypothetical protein